MTTVGRGAKAVADGWKISDGAERGVVGGLGIFESAVAEDAEADAGGLGISAGAEAGADVLEFSDRAGGDAGAGADAVDIDEIFRYVGEPNRNDDLNGDLNEGFDAATRAFPTSRDDLILNEVNFSSSSHFSISSFDHAVRSLSFSMSANAFAIDILPS